MENRRVTIPSSPAARFSYEVVVRISVAFLLILSLFTVVKAHGGEDHGDEKPVAAPVAGQADARLARAGNIEVLVKYPPPKLGEVAHLRIFLTDASSNAAVEGVKVSVRAISKNSSGETVVAEAGAQAGIYEAHVTFPEAGDYKLEIGLTGANLNDQVTIDGIKIAAPDSASAPTASDNRLIMGLTVLLVFAIVGYLFMLRPSKSEITSPAASTQERKA